MICEQTLDRFFTVRKHISPARYLHLGCHAPPHVLELERIRLVWAILRVRHPLLAAKVEMRGYDDVNFV